jgi:tRNA modification GTPase
LDDGQSDELRSIVEKLPTGLPMTVVRNKIDTTGREPGVGEGDLGPEVALSAKTGAGIEALRQHLKESMGYSGAGEGGFMARRRHVDALQRAHQCLENADHQFERHHAGELLAEDLRLAQQILSEITGEFTSDDLLGRIFASFCIGK